jgi:hypothetical protein
MTENLSRTVTRDDVLLTVHEVLLLLAKEMRGHGVEHWDPMAKIWAEGRRRHEPETDNKDDLAWRYRVLLSLCINLHALEEGQVGPMLRPVKANNRPQHNTHQMLLKLILAASCTALMKLPASQRPDVVPVV